MKLLKLFGVMGVLGILAGCASDIEQMRTVQATGGSPFTQALTEQYRQITLFEADEMYDWPDAGYFARKGLAAAAGEVVLPEELGNWDLPADKVDELSQARGQLMAALDAGGRENFPEPAARAQGRFDCWVEQQEENHQPDDIAACRDEFFAALGEMVADEVMMDAPVEYIVLFDFDKYNINESGAVVMAEVMAYVASRGVDQVNISAVGHTDRAGSEDYNMALSLRRADTVREALIDGGVPAEAITVAGRGESEPAVPTPDGVREQANRRVVIVVQ